MKLNYNVSTIYSQGNNDQMNTVALYDHSYLNISGIPSWLIIGIVNGLLDELIEGLFNSTLSRFLHCIKMSQALESNPIHQKNLILQQFYVSLTS